jgi:hypothetical protein
MAGETVARATIVLYDGAEQPVAEEVDVLLEIRNNYGVNQSNWVKGPVIQLNLQFFDGPGDNYTVTIWVKGNRGAGDSLSRLAVRLGARVLRVRRSRACIDT